MVVKVVKPKLKTVKKKKMPVIKKPAISQKLKADIIKHSNAIKKQKIEISKFKIGDALLKGEYRKLDRIYNKLVSMEHQTIVALEYLSDVKVEIKSSDVLIMHEKMLTDFKKHIISKRTHLTRAVNNKLHSLYEKVIEAEKVNIKQLSKREQIKLLDSLGTNFNNYQNIKMAFSSIDFSGSKNVDIRVNNMLKTINKLNSKVHS